MKRGPASLRGTRSSTWKRTKGPSPSRNSPGCYKHGGHLLIAFHIDSPEFATGQVNHISDWFGQHVRLDGYFLDPDEIASQVTAAGFTLIAKMERLPSPDVEYPSRRSYLLFQRN